MLLGAVVFHVALLRLADSPALLISSDSAEEIEGPAREQAGRRLVVRRQRGVREQVLLAGIEEPFGSLGGGNQRACRVEVALAGEERVGVHPVYLDGNAGRPGVAELRHREARVEEQRSPWPRRGSGLAVALASRRARSPRRPACRR